MQAKSINVLGDRELFYGIIFNLSDFTNPSGIEAASSRASREI